jgi:hypothetical protein
MPIICNISTHIKNRPPNREQPESVKLVRTLPHMSTLKNRLRKQGQTGRNEEGPQYGWAAGHRRPLATCVVVVSSDESDEFFYLIFSEEA